MNGIAKTSIRIAPPNSIVFISDPRSEVIPKIDKRSRAIWATPSCLAVGCLAAQDGETELTVFAGDAANEAARDIANKADFDQTFDGILDTPRQTLSVSTSERQVLLQVAVPTRTTRVRVLTDHPTEPERVVVLIN